MPAPAVPGGSVVKSSWVAVPAVSENALLVACVSPLEVAVKL